jgi:paraquat-inducible protein B
VIVSVLWVVGAFNAVGYTGKRFADVLSLDPAEMNMTVETYLKHLLEKMTEKANNAVDDAIDEVSLKYKQGREELQEYRHRMREEAKAKKTAGMRHGHTLTNIP